MNITYRYWGMPPDGFLYQRFDVRKVVSILKGRQPFSTNHTIKLFLCYFLQLGMHSHGKEKCRKRSKRLGFGHIGD